MRILICGQSPWSLSFSAIAPLRICRALRRAGHEVVGVDHPLPPHSSPGWQEHSWGKLCTASDYSAQVPELITSWEPHLVYSMGTSALDCIQEAARARKIPWGLHILDPYYARYPEEGHLYMYDLADFITCNEGQVKGYLDAEYPRLGEKTFVLNHAIDPELAPSWEEVVHAPKDYVCSMVGGDDRIRRRELLLFFYQWTLQFPDCRFATAGSLAQGTKDHAPYDRQDLDPSIEDGGQTWNHTTLTREEVERFQGVTFNVETIPHDQPPPLGLSHHAVHRLYMRSLYGFTPYGHYLRKGWQSQYNHHTYGTKIFEQGGSGAAMIANRIRDLEEIIDHGRTGYILDKPEDAYEVFKLAVENPDRVRRMGQEAYKDVHARHSWDVRYREVLLPIFRELAPV